MKHESYTGGMDCRLQPARPDAADPLPAITRCALVIEGPRWIEIDPHTGKVIDRDDRDDDETTATRNVLAG